MNRGQHGGVNIMAQPRPTRTTRSETLPGIAGWRWIFILQGVLSVVAALVGYVFIVDFPELSHKSFGLKFLTEKEAAFVVARIEKDRHDAIPEEFQLGKYLKNVLNLKVCGFATLFGLATTNAYAIACFLPIIPTTGWGSMSLPLSVSLRLLMSRRRSSCTCVPSWVTNTTSDLPLSSSADASC